MSLAWKPSWKAHVEILESHLESADGDIAGLLGKLDDAKRVQEVALRLAELVLGYVGRVDFKNGAHWDLEFAAETVLAALDE